MKKRSAVFILILFVLSVSVAFSHGDEVDYKMDSWSQYPISNWAIVGYGSLLFGILIAYILFFNERMKETEKKIVFYCLSGKRSASAGMRWADHTGVKEAYCLKGGLESWKKMGLPTVVNLDAERKVEHQAYILAGFLAIAGSLLAALVSDWFLIVPMLTGLLLMFSGFAGHCYIAYLLSKLPYNR